MKRLEVTETVTSFVGIFPKSRISEARLKSVQLNTKSNYEGVSQVVHKSESTNSGSEVAPGGG